MPTDAISLLKCVDCKTARIQIPRVAHGVPVEPVNVHIVYAVSSALDKKTGTSEKIFQFEVLSTQEKFTARHCFVSVK
jgi:hypothetical protein